MKAKAKPQKKAAPKAKKAAPKAPKGVDPAVTKAAKDKARSMPMGARCFERSELETIFLTIAEAGKGDGLSISPAVYAAVQQKLDEIFGLDPATLAESQPMGDSKDV